ncbi:MAG: DNA polymerase III subunit alpha [Candidatus Peribacteraceae bacterium]|nr:DNA polymerase III subunit alpha [Candidatus Peribacteraceae bacterium]
MKPEDFVHLHCHTTYSLLEALPAPEEVVARAKALGQTAVGIADKGYSYGLVEFYQDAKKAGLKPILGVEVFQAARTRFDKESGTDTRSAPLVLLAETQEGYQNLLELCTLAAVEGMYYKPRVDAELLKKFGKGLICLTGQLSGLIPQAALLEDGARVKQLTEELWSYFGKDKVYFELQDLPGLNGQAEANQQLIRFAKELGVPLVATCGSYYCETTDAEAHDVLLCIQKSSLVEDPGRFNMRDSDYSMRPFEEMEKAFAHVPEALENTRVIADRCTVDFEFGKNQIPHGPVTGDRTEDEEMERLAREGFARRYPVTSPELEKRLDYELSVIRQVKFAGYFLIVADFVNEARRRGIMVGPGRGSAAGSMVSYCLGITNFDPIPQGLLFERFLNPERISMPDIDMDFADDRRDEVLEYVREKYGRDRVVQICTFGTLAARAAVKDVGRAFGISFLEMNALAKMVPEKPGTTLDQALATSELKAAYESNDAYKKIIDIALKLEGKARHISVHACGVIITPKPAIEYTAVQKAPKDDDTIITQYSAKPLESLGLLKMDFLGLMNLTVIQTALKIIERTRGETVDIEKIPTDDKASFNLLKSGNTTGVFQLESAGMRRYLKQLKPTRFEDIMAMCALYRPGPMESIPTYIKGKNDPKSVKYEVPELEPFLKETYGIMVYQEQVQRVAQEFAGFSLGAGYLLIKAVAKKIPKLLAEQKEKFVQGAVAIGKKKEVADKIFALIEPFAGYGFNKSHAACYARIAYETAYLKANYTAEFMAALLSSDSQDTDRVMIEIEECRSMGIDVLPPDINESRKQFTVITPADREGSEGRWAIRFGLSAVKGIGESSVDLIIAERDANGPYASLETLARRVPAKVFNKKLLEALAKSGAIDRFAERNAVITHYDRITSYAKDAGATGGQADLFGAAGLVEEATIDLPFTPPASPQQKLIWEKETLGLYVSSHPLAGMKKYIAKKARLIGSLESKDIGKKVTVAGIEEGFKPIRTKKGDTMGILTLEDPTGKIEVTLFPKAYAELQDQLGKPDTVLVVGGTLEARAGQYQVIVDAIKRASLTTMIERAKTDGFWDEEEAKRGVQPVRAAIVDDEEDTEVLDDDGNVVAGETAAMPEAGPSSDLSGPLAVWIAKGMPTDEPLRALGMAAATPAADAAPSVSINTVALPARAPKQLLLDLKKLFETFPGPERVRLKIGEQLIDVPLTVTMSPILEAKIADLLALHASEPTA